MWFDLTVEKCEQRIKELEAEIERNRYNPSFFEKTPVVTMHDTNISSYEATLQDISYYKTQIDRLQGKY